MMDINDPAKTRAIAVATAAAFVVLGGVAATLTGLRLVPSIAVLTMAALLFLFLQHARRWERAAGAPLPLPRVLSVIFCLGVTAVGVAMTGGTGSPFTGVLFLPILLSALSFGFGSSVLTGVVLSTLFLLRGMQEMGAWTVPSNRVLAQVIVFALVGMVAGSFADSLRRVADEAVARAGAEEARAAAQEARTAETEAFLDTSVMMESMYDLDATLDIGLLRLAELVPYDVCAVFLRELDSPHLHVERLIGLPREGIAVSALPLDEIEAQWGGNVSARLWPDIAQDVTGLGALAALDPAAHGVIVAPLRTPEHLYGAIYVSAHGSGSLVERHRKIIDKFALCAVFPIQHAHQRRQLQALATTDAMTGLHNYRSFRLRLADEVRRAYRYGHPLSLILLDIDHFKEVNDTYGHPAGDSLLKQMGTVLHRSLRGIDIAARYGGEEMAIICPETAAEDVYVLAERIRATVAANLFVLPENREVRMTVSVGVATLPAQAAGDGALVERADKALYAAKMRGRDSVCTAADAMVEAAAT